MIDENALRAAYKALSMRIDALERASGLFASDEDLADPRFGDPVVKFDVRGWKGQSCIGKHFSECPVDFLDRLADALTYSANNPKAGKEKFASFNRRDAGKARSYARRLRSGVGQPTAGARAIANGVPAPEAVAAPEVESPQFDAPAIDEPMFGEPSDADEDAELPTF